MDNKKFEQLIDLIINENEDQARQLFHEIIVEKSREIYESIMDEEMMDESMHEGMADDMEEGMGGQVGDLLDEINAEEEMSEAEDDEDIEVDDEEEIELMPGDEEDDMAGAEDIEDRVADVEEKVDEIERLMAEFEAEMRGGSDDMGDEEGMEMGDEEEVAMMENVQLKQVGGQTYNTYGKMGDNGAQTKSPNLNNSGQAGMDSKPVKFSGAAESVPTSPKGPSNLYNKGETQVKGAGNFKNSPAKDNFREKGESTPKPVTKDGAADKHSPVAKS